MQPQPALPLLFLSCLMPSTKETPADPQHGTYPGRTNSQRKATAGSPEEASSLSTEERTFHEACRSSNASSSGGGDDHGPSESAAEGTGELDGGAPPGEHTVGDTSGVGNAQEQQHQHEESNADEAGKPSVGSHLVSMLMVAGGVAVAIAAAFLVIKKR